MVDVEGIRWQMDIPTRGEGTCALEPRPSRKLDLQLPQVGACSGHFIEATPHYSTRAQAKYYYDIHQFGFFASVEDNQKLDEIMEEYLKRRFGPDFKMPQQLNTSNSLLGPSPSLPTQEFSREDYVSSSQLNKTALNDNSRASIHQQAASFEGDKIKSKSQLSSQPIDKNKQLNNHSSTDQSAVIPLSQSNGGARQDMLSTLPTLQQRATNTLPPLVVATRHRQQFIVENEIDELVLDDEVNEETANKGKKKRQTTLHRII